MGFTATGIVPDFHRIPFLTLYDAWPFRATVWCKGTDFFCRPNNEAKKHRIILYSVWCRCMK